MTSFQAGLEPAMLSVTNSYSRPSQPGFYVLMYGQVTPGSRPPAQDRPFSALSSITQAASAQGRLVVSPAQAAAHILAANVGVTLRQIVLDAPDPILTAAMCDATIEFITGSVTSIPAENNADLRHTSVQLLDLLPAAGDILDEPETVLLRKWLATIARTSPGAAVSPDNDLPC